MGYASHLICFDFLPRARFPLANGRKHVHRPLVEGDAGPGDENGHFPVSFHLASAPAIWIDQSGFSKGKTVLFWRQVLVNRKDTAVGQLFSITMAFDNCENWLLIQKTLPDWKREKYEIFCAFNLTPKWVVRVRPLTLRGLSPGWSFQTKYTVVCQIKLRILDLNIRRGQSD